ncbi:MAG: hypothetical protein JRF69_11415, partial [Deltaproteobacteria bacterium]|nr:hypothetical protein [Deltaproteobacteria bacterium]
MTILIAAGVLLWVFSFSGMATADMYTDSAHGNNGPDPAYGVNRVDKEDPIGDCAHCHDAANSANCGAYSFMLFSDDALAPCELFCFDCHSGS